MSLATLFGRKAGYEQLKSARRKQRALHQALRRRPLTLEPLEERRMLAVWYVDDTPSINGPGMDVFTPSGGSQVTTGMLTLGTNLFTTISAAVAAANNGDTINVADGTYAETVLVNKSLILLGNQFGVDARGRAATETILSSPGANSFTLTVGSANTVIDGFSSTSSTRSIESTGGPIDNLQILNNRMLGFTGSGIFLNDSGTNVTVDRNVLDGTSQSGSGAVFHLDTDLFAGLHITNNNIVNGGATNAGLFVDGNENVRPSTGPGGRNPLISSNLFDGNSVGANIGTRAFGQLAGMGITGTISNNIFSNNDFDGLQGGPRRALITQNTFSGNDRWGLALTAFGNMNADRGAQFNIISENFFSNNTGLSPSGDVLFSTGQPDVNNGTNQLINNSLTSPVGVAYSGAQLIQGSGNWWGSASGPTAATNPDGTGASLGGTSGGNIDFSPWLDSGMDTMPGTAGFQGSFSILHVEDTSPHSTLNEAAATNIQEAIELVTASEVILDAGNYNEDVVANELNLILRGLTGNPADVMINGASPVAIGGTGVTVTANNVTLRDLRITGFATGINATGVTPLTLANVLIDGNTSGGSLTNIVNLNLDTDNGNDVVRVNVTAGDAVSEGIFSIDSEVQVINYSMVGTLDVDTLGDDDTVRVAAHTSTLVDLDGGLQSMTDKLFYYVTPNAFSTLPTTITTATKANINYVDFESLCLFGGDPIINGTGDDDQLIVTATGPNSGSYQLIQDFTGENGGPFFGPVVMFAGLNSLTFNGLGDDDLLTINNPAMGLFAPTGGVFYNGGAHDDDGDALEILGGTAASVHHVLANNNDGGVRYNGSMTNNITYTGLEPVDDTIVAADRIFTFNNAAGETIVWSNPAMGMNRLDSDAGEMIDFANPTGSLTINITDNAGDTDTLNINAIDAGFGVATTINGAAGDTVNFNTTLTAGAGSVMITVQDVAFNAGGAITTTGSVTLSATGASGGVSADAMGTDITANVLSITAGGDGIGSMANPLRTNVTSVTASATGTGAIHINEANAVTLTSVTTAGGAIGVTSGGAMTATNVAAGGASNIALTTTVGDILANLVDATGDSATLMAAGAIQESGADGTADIVASTIDLTAGTGIGTAGQLEINAATLNASTTAGNINLHDTAGGVAVGLVSAAAGAADVTLHATGGGITSAAGDAGVADIVANILIFNLLTNGNSLGTSAASRLEINAVEMQLTTVNAPLANNAFIVDTAGGLRMNNASVGASGTATFDILVQSGNLTSVVDGTRDVGGVIINLEVTGAGSTIGASTANRLEINSPTTSAGAIVNATTAGGDIFLRDTADSFPVGSINAGAGSIHLLTTTGAIVDANGATNNLTATSAALSATTGIGSADALETTIANVAYNNSTSGDVRITDSAGGLTVNSVGTLATSSNVGSTFLVANSPITFAVNSTQASILAQAIESAAVNTDNITVDAGVTVTATAGDVTFEAGDRIIVNATATVQATASTGNVIFDSGFGDTDGDGSMTLNGAISAGATTGVVTLDLNAQQGATQAATGTITGSGLRLLSTGASGSFDLDASTTNNVATLAANTGGMIEYRDANGLDVNNVGGTNGITTSGDDVTICVIAGNLNLSRDISVGMATVRLQTDAGGSGIVQGMANAILAGALGLRAGTGGINLPGPNDVDTLAATTTGSFTYQDNDGVALGTVTADGCFTPDVTGVTAGGGFELCVGGALSIDQPINAAGQTVRLEANGGGVSQMAAGVITAANLGVLAAGAIDLNNATNAISGNIALETTAAGNIDFLNGGTFSLSSISPSSCFSGAAEVTAFSGNVDLQSNTGSILDAQNDASTDVTGVNVVLTAATGVGAAGNSLDTAATTLDVSVTMAGLINLQETNAVTLSDIDTANGPITILAGGAIDVVDVDSTTDADANDISITATTGNISFTAAGAVTAGAGVAADVFINAMSGNLVDTLSDSLTDIVAHDASLTASGDIGQAGTAHIDTQVVNLTTSSNSSVVAGTHGTWINEVNAINVISATTTDGVIFIDNATGLLDAQLVNAGGTGRNVRLRAMGGDIHAGSITALGDGVGLSATGAITDGDAGNDISALNLVMIAGTGIAGGPADPLETTVTNLAWTSGTGSIDLVNTGALNITMVTVSGVSATGGMGSGHATITASSPMDVFSSIIHGMTITLTSTDNTADDHLIIHSPATVQATGAGEDVNLNAGDNFTLQSGATVQAADRIWIIGDAGNSDPGVGSTINLFGTITGGTSATLVWGNSDPDAIDLTPNATTGLIRMDGGNSGDTFHIQFGNLQTNPPIAVSIEDTGAMGDDRATLDGVTAAETFEIRSFGYVGMHPTNPFCTDLTGGFVDNVTEDERVDYEETLEFLTVRGQGGNDIFNAEPSQTTEITVNGNAPSFGDPGVPPGDTLNFNSLNNTFTIVGKTIFTDDCVPPFKGVNFLSIENFPLNPPGDPASNRRFDFDAVEPGGVTQAMYTSVGPTHVYDPMGTPGMRFGWTTTVGGFDRGSIAPVSTFEDLLRDGHWGIAGQPRVFKTDVADGWYLVSVKHGDAQYGRDLLEIRNADTNKVLATGLSTPPGESAVTNFVVQVKDGTLDLQFADLGGDPYWTLNGLEIRAAVNGVFLSEGIPDSGPFVADGVTVDMFTGHVGTPNALITVATTLGTVIATDLDPNIAGIQVMTNAMGMWTFGIQRPIGGGMALVSFNEVTGAKTGCSVITYTLPDNRRFDFNSGGSPTQAPTLPPNIGGYIGVQPTDLYTMARGYGWNQAVGGYDRGDLPGAEPQEELRRDGHWGYAGGGNERVFQVDLPNATYSVNVTIGDLYGRDAIQLHNADTNMLLATVNTPPGQWANVTFNVSVTDGSLNLRISDLGGDPYWVINGMEVRTVGSVTPITVTTAGGTLAADGLTVDTFMVTAPAGVLYTLKTDKGTITGPADASAVYVGLQLVGTGAPQNFMVQRPASSGTATIMASSVDGQAAGMGTQMYGVAAVRRFDFDAAPTSAAITAAGFIPVRGNQTYSQPLGFGWNTAVGEFDRGTGPATVALKRDGHWGIAGQPRIFSVEVVAGTYGFRAYIGDASYGRDAIQVQAEGGAPVVVNTAAGVVTAVTFTGMDTNADNRIDITVSDLGGDPYWVINGLDVALGGVGGLPGAAQASLLGVQADEANRQLTPEELQPLVDEAIARWVAAGITPEQAAALAAATIEIVDLDSHGYLGLADATGLSILIDNNAAGFGWFVDETVGDDSEFTLLVSATELRADSGSQASSGVDLLSVLLHEMGHLLGLDDLDDELYPHELMTENLGLGIRRLPAPVAASAAAVDAALASMAAAPAALEPAAIDPLVLLGSLESQPLLPPSTTEPALAAPRVARSAADVSTADSDDDALSTGELGGTEVRPPVNTAGELEELDAYFSLLGEAL